MKLLPLAREASLVVKEVDEETLVYDLETDQAHCLNSTAARVWRSCDGSTSVDEIALQLSTETNCTVDPNFVWVALDQLEKFKLLQEPVERPLHLTGVSRRQAVRTFGFAAALAIPLVTSIIAPTPAQAQSGNLGDCCESKDDCLPQFECSSNNPRPECEGGKSCEEHAGPNP